MTRRNIPVQLDKHVVDGFYDSQTGDVRIQLDMPLLIEGITNTAIIIDASKSMDKHFRKQVVKSGPSDVEEFIRRAGKVISEMASDQKVRIYLCCLNDGTEVLDMGNFTQDRLESLQINLNRLNVRHGFYTYLLPAIEKAVKEIFLDSGCKYGFLIAITDGKLDDFEKIKAWTIDLAKKIGEKQHPLTKIVLIGFNDADQAQLEALDNLDTGNGVDIFNALSVETLQEAMELLDSEAIIGDMIIAPQGRIEVNGRTVVRYEEGLPQRIDATIPPNLHSITIIIEQDGQEESLKVDLE